MFAGTSSFAQSDGNTAGNDWEFVIAPYLFMGSLSGESTVGIAGPSEVDLDFGDILKKLQFAFMIRGEVYKGNWGLIADYLYLKLGDDIDTPGELLVADIEVKQGIFELFLSRRFRQGWGWFDVYAGIRTWDIGLRLNLDGLEQVSAVTFDQNWVDPVIGGRVFYQFSDRFLANFRADIGGFGAGSDFTYTLQPGLGYSFSDWFTLMLQYKYLATDYTNDKEGLDFFAYDANMNGPLLGLVFRF
jgi:hypothetical protein